MQLAYRIVMAFALVLAASSVAFALDYYAASTTLEYGTNTTSPSYLNANDSQYYNVSSQSALINNTHISNPDFNGGIGSWTNGNEDAVPTENTFAYDNVLYYSAPGSGTKLMQPGATQDSVLLSGTAYQALSSAINQTTQNWFDFRLKFDSISNPSNTQWSAICTELFGTVGGTASRRLYYCYAVEGALPADTVSIKYVSLGSGTNISWQFFSRNVTADVNTKWGAGTTYSFTEVRLVNRMLTANIPNKGEPALTSHFDDIYVKRESTNNLITARHTSSAAPNPANFIYDNVSISLTMKASTTNTYGLLLYNFNTSVWDSCDSKSVNTTPATMSCAKTSSPANYINSTSYSILVGLSTTASASTTSSEDYVLFSVGGKYMTNISIWDDTDTMVRYENDTINFYANYSNKSNNAPVDGTGVCQVSFYVGGSWTAWANMTYDAPSGRYNYGRSFTTAGSYVWNVSCSKTGYQSQITNSTVDITARVPYVRTDRSKYTQCPSTVYYKVVMTGNSSYDVAVRNPNNVSMQTVSDLSSNYTGSYVLSTYADPGSWSVIVYDKVWQLQAYHYFEVRPTVAYQTVVRLSTRYVSVGNNKDTNINLYAVNGSSNCNLTIQNSAGVLAYNSTVNFSDTWSSSLNSLGGAGWSYPVMMRIDCDKQVVAVRDPDAQGLIVFANYDQLSNDYWGAITAGGVVRISAPYAAINYTINTWSSNGNPSGSWSGTIPENGSAAVSVNAPGGGAGGIHIVTNYTALVYYEPGGKTALPYSADSLMELWLAPVNDMSGTSVYIFSPNYATDIAITIYPRFGCYRCPQEVLCHYNISLLPNRAWSGTYSSMLSGCEAESLYTNSPTGTMIFNSTSPVVIVMNSWNGAVITSPVYRYGSFYTTNYFTASSSSIKYLIFVAYEPTDVTVNGVYMGLRDAFSLVSGTVSSNKLNVSASKPLATSVGYGSGESIVIAYGQ
jgi:hypothetical protein